VFSALASEPPGARAAAAEASAALCAAYASAAPQPVRASLRDMLSDGVADARASDGVRAAALRWSNALFPFEDARARALCILAAGDAKLEVRDEAARGLVPGRSSAAPPPLIQPAAAPSGPPAPSPTYPALTDMLAVLEAAHPRLKRAAAMLAEGGADSPGSQAPTLLLPPRAVQQGVTFLRACRAACPPPDGQLAPAGYRAWLELACVREATADLWLAALSALREDAAAAPPAAAAAYAPRMTWLRGMLTHTDGGVRDAASQLLALAAAGAPPEACAQLIASLAAVVCAGAGAAAVPGAVTAAKVTFEEAEGSSAALGFILAQACTELFPVVDPQVLAQAAEALAGALGRDNYDGALQAAAAAALGHAGLRAPLPLPEGQSPDQGDQTGGAGGGATRARVAAHVCRLLKSSKDAKVQARAARACGHLAAGDPSCAAMVAPATAALLACTDGKVESLTIACGDALAAIFAGMPHDALQAELRGEGAVSVLEAMSTEGEEEDEEATSVRTAAMDTDVCDPPARVAAQKAILEALLGKLAVSSRPMERCCAAAWLLSLATRAHGHLGALPPATRRAVHPALAPRLREMQGAFSGLLGDASETTQDLAAQGLSAVHRRGDAATRALLVDSLVATLAGDSARAAPKTVKMEADTEVFAQGALGDAPSTGTGAGSGGGLSTYKELCAMATEMGQPDLVYRFMDLANHAKAMNAKRGAAFGFATIAKRAGTALAPHMGALVPKLFVMVHDPAKGIQDAATAIWSAVVMDPRAALDTHFDSIARNCLREMGGRLWRAREAAASALAELLTGRRWAQLQPHFTSCWTMALRALDDIKDSVRVAAAALARTLAALTVKFCDADGKASAGADAAAALAQAMPLLLTQGVPAQAAEVRFLAVRTVSQIADKAAPDALRPHLADVVGCMLEALSSMEDSRLNYVTQHAAAAGINAEALDAARVAASRGGLLGDTLERCLNHCTADALPSVVPRLSALARSGTGLATRAGTARFAAALASRCPGGLGAVHAQALLTSFTAALAGESALSVRCAYAAAAAAAARTAPPARLSLALQAALAPLHADADTDEEACARGALLVRALSRDAPDALQPLLPDLLPYAFLGKHAAQGGGGGASSAPLWAEVWEANTGAERAALRLYAPEIAALCAAQLAATSWGRKRAGAAACASLARGLAPPQSAAGVEEEALARVAPHLLAALLGALPGRVWEGKASVLDAAGALAAAAPAVLSSQAPALVATALTAAQRRQATYRLAGLGCLTASLRAFKGTDFWGVVAPALLPAASQVPVAPPPSGAAADSLAEEDQPVPPPPAGESLKALAAAWAGASPQTVEAQSRAFADALALALTLDRDWMVRSAALEAASALAAKPPSAGVPSLLLQPLLANVSDPKAAAVRTAAVELLGVICAAAVCTFDVQAVLAALQAAAVGDANGGVRGAAERVAAAICARSGDSNARAME